ncbi:MAG: NAD-dependent epimerase/dehydratase family protein [Cytophagales bacterium]
MQDKVFITGATGLLGSFILRDLLKHNYAVKALCRSNSNFNLVDDIKEEVEWYEGDMCDYLSMEKAISDCNIVIHSAAVVSYDKKDKENMISINVNGTRNLVDLSNEKKVDHFIQISSIAAIGRPKTQFELDEATKWEESPNNSVYAKSKFYSELEVWRAIEEGLKGVILNPGFILGPGDPKKSSTQLFNYVWKKSKFYTVGNLNYVDVRDVSDAVINVLKKQISGERFIICGGTIRFKDLFQKIAKNWNVQAPGIKISKSLSNVIWRLEAIRTFVFGGKPIITKDSANSANSQYVLKSDKSKKDLGIEYRSLDDTIQWICPKLAPKLSDL